MGWDFMLSISLLNVLVNPLSSKLSPPFSTFSPSVLLPELDIRLTDAPPSRDIPFIVQDDFYSVDNTYLFRMLFSQDAIVTTHIVFRAWQ